MNLVTFKREKFPLDFEITPLRMRENEPQNVTIRNESIFHSAKYGTTGTSHTIDNIYESYTEIWTKRNKNRHGSTEETNG